MKILFVCSANEDRSPTAERLYSNHPGLEVKSAMHPNLQKEIKEKMDAWLFEYQQDKL